MGAQPWEATRVLTNGEAADMIESQFPDLQPVNIRELGKGFDNTVFLVNDEFVFRFPRREISEQLLKVENHLLRHLSARFHLAIPEPAFLGKPAGDYPWIFTGYKLIKGDVPGVSSDEQRLQSVKPLAQFFKTLHTIPITKDIEQSLPKDEFDRLNIAKRKEKLEENVRQAMNLGLWENSAVFELFLAGTHDIPVEGAQVITHGDPHIRNLIVNQKGVVSGIIDWGDTHIGHPAVDLSIVYSFIPQAGRELFFELYGKVNEQTKQLARFKAVYTSLLLLLYGHDQKDNDLVLAAKQSLEYSLSS